MKKLLFLFLLFMSSLSLWAQEDRFTDVNQTKGKDIFVTDNSALAVAFSIVDGKVKPIKKIKNLNASMEGKVFSVGSESYIYKKKAYIILKNSSDIILLKEEDAPLYISTFISKTYWQEKYDLYSKDYAFLDFTKYPEVHSERATVRYDDLTSIEWKGLEISDNGAVYYISELQAGLPLDKFKVTSSLFETSKDVFFLKRDSIQPYIIKYNTRIAKEKREKEIADSLANTRLRLAIALKDGQFDGNERPIYVNKGDTLAVFSYNPIKRQFLARFHSGTLLFNPDNIEFLDTKTTTTEGRYSWDRTTTKTSVDSDFLKEQGENGKEQRFAVAEAYDDVHTLMWLNNLKAALDKYEAEIRSRKKNQIFITGIGYEYDGSRFGMHFDVYNCFPKTIKYIEFTLTNYNAVGDIQMDDIGRSARTVRGIGPIEPEDGGRYSWDDIFWDDRDIIDKTRLTNVKFIFTDGTTKVFSGYANINKHMTADAWAL